MKTKTKRVTRVAKVDIGNADIFRVFAYRNIRDWCEKLQRHKASQPWTNWIMVSASLQLSNELADLESVAYNTLWKGISTSGLHNPLYKLDDYDERTASRSFQITNAIRFAYDAREDSLTVERRTEVTWRPGYNKDASNTPISLGYSDTDPTLITDSWRDPRVRLLRPKVSTLKLYGLRKDAIQLVLVGLLV